jgi:2''-5'' RNA ligase
MRAFVAINFDDRIKDILTAASEELKRISKKGNFSRRVNYHLTLDFLGEIDKSQIMDVESAMKEACEAALPFDIKIDGAGRFSKRGGDIYWFGIEQNQELSKLQGDLTDILAEKGFRTDEKAYRPHLTLGRQVRADYDEVLKILQSYSFPLQHVQEIALMESSRIDGRLTYTKLFGIAL